MPSIQEITTFFLLCDCFLDISFFYYEIDNSVKLPEVNTFFTVMCNSWIQQHLYIFYNIEYDFDH